MSVGARNDKFVEGTVCAGPQSQPYDELRAGVRCSSIAESPASAWYVPPVIGDGVRV
jgi:hypothetical protein